MGSTTDNMSHPLRIFVFDNPRTNCQVFYKMFCKHPQLGWMKAMHTFAGAAMYGPERLQLRTRNSEAADKAQVVWGTQYPEANTNTFESSQKDMREQLKETEDEGKIFFGKEHICLLFNQDLILSILRRDRNRPVPKLTSNPTYIPDDIFNTLTPLMVFRHPGLVVPSSYSISHELVGAGPSEEIFQSNCTLLWCQMLYDYFISIGKRPVLVEAQDFVYNTKPVMDKVCRDLGIDESGWTDTWDPVPKEYWPDHKIGNAMTGAMMASSGLERRSKEPAELTLDLDIELEKWKKAYGEETALGIRKMVDEEMPIYEYLKTVKLRV